MMLTGAAGSSVGGGPLVRFTGGSPISANVALTPSKLWPPRTIATMRRKACLYQPVVCSPPFWEPSQLTALQALRQRFGSPRGRM
jgi:hypothetical protein